MTTITTDTFPIMGIYSINNCLNGKRYVGQAINIVRRWNRHKTCNDKGVSAIHLALKAVGIENFTFEVLEECSRELLNERECFWIKQLNTVAPNGYNLNSGGKHPLFISDETRKKQSIAQRGKVQSQETIEKRRKSTTGLKRTTETKTKMSLAQKGKTLTTEHRKNLSNAHKGKPSSNKGIAMSDETKKKVSKAKQGVPASWRNVAVIRNDGVCFPSLKAAASEIGATAGGVLRVLRGLRMTIYGWSFSYADKVGV